MKKLFFFVMACIASVAMMAESVTFDFTTAESLQAMNIVVPSTSNATNLSTTPVTIGEVTMASVKNNSADTRIWGKNDGTYELRTYNTNTITFSASEPITAIEAKGSNVKFNELTNGTWQGSATSVTLTACATCNITRFIIHMGESVEVWTPDTVSVSEAIALIAAGDDRTHYVKGVVAKKAWVASGSYPANVTFNLIDCETSTDTIQAYLIAKNNMSAKFQSQADADSLICLGDTLLVFANQLMYYVAGSLNEINGGYYVEVLGKAHYQVLPVTYGEAIYHGQMPNAWEFSLVLSAAEEELPMIDLRFNSANEHGIAGSYSTFHSVVYTNENGTPLSADNVALTLSLASVSANDYNIYNIELFFDVNETHYRYEGQLEIAGYTEGYEDYYFLSGDRPFIPQAGDTLTCAQARKYTLSLPMSDVTTDEFTIVGYVTNTNGTVSRNQQVFWIDDQRGTSQTVQAYYCNVPNGNAIPVDTKVAITGKLMNYNNTIAEIKNGTATIINNSTDVPDDWTPSIGYQFSEGNLNYEITNLNPNKVAVRGGSFSAPTNLVIPDNVEMGGVNFAVTEIYGNAFGGNNYITSVTIPESITRIWYYAFNSCNNLTSVTWNAISSSLFQQDGNELDRPFRECNNITSFVFGDSVRVIPKYLCYGLSSLTSIQIPERVEKIYYNAFYDCNNLTSVTWNARNCSVGGESYYYSGSYDERVYYWYDATDSPFPSSVQTFTFGSNVQTIPNYLCADLNQVSSITIPNSVTKLGTHTFSGCSGLSTITLPTNLYYIGNNAFNSCGLTSIMLPESLDTLYNNAFSECNDLTSVIWNAQNCVVGYYESHYHYDEDGNEYYTNDWRDATSSPFPSSVQTFTFGNNVQTIPDYLCAYLNQISSITIPNGVNKIGICAFNNCTGLTSVTIGNNVSVIGTCTFYNCTGLASVTMPNSVKRIEAETFRNCTSLASINLSNNLDYIGSKAFVNSGLMSVMIPESLDTIVSDAFYYYDYDNNDNNSNLSLVIWNARNCANVSTSQNWNSQLQEYEYSYYESTSSPFPSSVETFIFGDNVQKVPSGLCSGLNQLTSIALPNTVRTIGSYAFSGCSGLISFTMENGVQTIGNSAFSSCSNLPQIVLPNTVTKIGHNAFNSCSNLTTAIVGNSVDTIGVSAFSYCKRLISIELPTTVNYIGGSAFYNCTSMNKAIIRSTAELDPYCMLLLNPQIDTIIAPASIFDIDEQHRLDYVCTKRMKYVKANSGELTEDAFVVIRRSASTLETLDVSATTNTTIADEAFSNMYRLTTLGLPQGLDRISYKAVAECVRLQSIDIPAGITEIGDRAFEDCRSLTTITFGGQSGATADVALQTIGNWAFYNNHALQQLTIPAGVTTIGAGAFYGCTYLEDLAMPASLRNVGDNAFALCNHLTKMQVEADLPPMVAARTFFDVSRNIPVYVPDEAVNDYRNTAIWQEFFIRPISQAATGIETVRESDSDSQNEMLPDGKFMEDGRLLIRRNGKTYDAQGRLIR